MIQDICPSRFNQTYDASLKPEQGDALLCLKKGNIILASLSQDQRFPTYGEIQPKEEVIYLFSIDEDKYFLCLEEVENPPEGFSYMPLREFRMAQRKRNQEVFAAFTAAHLAEWYRSNRFCGECGSPTKLATEERRIDCTSCSHKVYPRINPAVIVGVKDKDRLLITHYARGRGVTMPALVAGFTEIGETYEDTVRREVMEEVGLKVKNIRYYKSQPWGIASDLLAGFYCEVDGEENLHVDTSELSDAAFLKREEIVGQPDNLSLTNEMMLRFRDGLE